MEIAFTHSIWNRGAILKREVVEDEALAKKKAAEEPKQGHKPTIPTDKACDSN